MNGPTADHVLPFAGTLGRAARLEDRQFALMQRAFEDAGGLLDESHLERMLRPCWSQPISVLARWIIDRRIVAVAFQGSLWIPLFQFELGGMHLNVNVARVIDELAPAFDDWELALWFSSPNDALNGAAPVAAMGVDPDEVLAAARVDRFIALG